MPVFAYKVCDCDGNHVRGSLTADTPALGRQLLRARGMRLLEFHRAQFDRTNRAAQRTGRSRRQEQTSEFARQLSMLLSTGVPLVEALDVLIRQHTRRLGPVLRDIRERVAAGSSLSDALAAHPVWFDNIFCSAIKVGQMSGHMDTALKELAAYVRERQTAKARLFTALAYPTILGILGTGVVIFLMTYVVPQLLAVLEASGRSLPISTVLLKAISNFLLSYWVAIVVFIALLYLGGMTFYRWTTGRRLCHELQLRLPIAGILIRKILVVQFAQMMSLLLRSGVPFVESLRLVRDNTRHMVLDRELEQMGCAIQRGSDIAPTLEYSKIFPPLVVHIVNVGQKSGELTEMLTQLKEGYEAEVRLAVGKFTATLEPMLIVVMAAVVGFVVFATMMPILEVTRAIQ